MAHFDKDHTVTLYTASKVVIYNFFAEMMSKKHGVPKEVARGLISVADATSKEPYRFYFKGRYGRGVLVLCYDEDA